MNKIITTFALTSLVLGVFGANSVSAAFPTVDLRVNGSNGYASVSSGGTVNLTWTSSGAIACSASGAWGGVKPLNNIGGETSPVLTTTRTFSLTCINADGQSAFDSMTVNVQTEQPVLPNVDIKANNFDGPITIDYLASANLSWTSQNATSCSASGSWSGSKQLDSSQSTGSLNTGTYTYTINCQNSAGSDSDSVTVNVRNQQVDNSISVSLSANPNSVNQNGSSVLSWTSQNAAYCIADGGITVQWVGDKSVPSGSTQLTNLTTTRTYGITCYNSQGNSAHDDETIIVTNNTAPTVTIYAQPNSVLSGAQSRLYWNSQNASTCQATGGPWSGPKNLNDNESTNALYSATTFSITCQNSSGQTDTDSVTVNIQTIQTNQPPTLNFYPNPSVVSTGNTSTLYWSTTNADYCVASGDWSGTKSVNNSQVTDSIYSTRNYILTCYGPGGSVVRNTTVSPQGIVLGAVAPTLTIYAIPAPVQYGSASNVYWNSQNATNCYASGNWFGDKSLVGQYPTGPLFADSTYTMTCYGTGGTITRSAVVPVIRPVYVPPVCPPAGCVQGVIYSPVGNYGASIEKAIQNTSTNQTANQSGTVIARPGNELRYTITVRNTGTLTLTNLVVRDPLSDKVEVRTISDNGTYDYTNRTVTWKISRLGVGESKTLTLNVRVIQCDSDIVIENRAYVDNSQISEVSSNNTVAGISTGLFELNIENNDPVVNPGDKVTYIIRYRNTSSQSVQGAMLNVYIPSGMIIEGYTETCTIDGNTLNLNLGTVAPGQSGQVQVVGKIDQAVLDGEQLVTRAVVSYRDSSGYTRESSAETISTVDRDGNELASTDDSSDGRGLRFLPDTFFGWLLLLLLIIVLAIFIKRLLTKDEPAK